MTSATDLDWSSVPAARALPRFSMARLVRSHTGDPKWARPSLLALLLLTAVTYLWGLGSAGYANDFYAAAVQAGTQSWKALFFGSLDSSNFITVDKPPASLWVMGLSGRLFGFNAWSMLAPQALMAVASVGFLYATVRRVAGPAAALFAGAAFAVMPVSALMFRYNNPDALLVLLLVAGAWFATRAIEDGRMRWLLLAGVCVGIGVLTKMGQALVVVPAFAVAYLVAAPNRLRTRIVHLLAGGAALIASAGWWIAIVELWPASSRPYIGGSTNNSVLQLALGYNGIGRLTGNEGGGLGGGGGGMPPAGARIGGGPGGAGGLFGGSTGWSRLFTGGMSTDASWLLPAALLALVAGLWVTRKAPRTDAARAALLLWGGWVLVTGAVFSFASGIIHEYYTVALVPGVAALLAVGCAVLWRERRHIIARLVLAMLAVGTGAWSFVLLHRAPAWNPWLRYVVLVAAVLAGVGLIAVIGRPARGRRWTSVGLGTLALAGLSAVAAPAAFTVNTVGAAHSGAIPTAGPAEASGFGGGMPGGGQILAQLREALQQGQLPNGAGMGSGLPTGGDLPGGGSAFGGEMPTGGFPAGGGGLPAGGGLPGGSGLPGGASSSSGGSPRFGGAPGAGAGPRGIGGASSVNRELVALLKQGSAGYRWVAAATGSMSAAPLELASREPVMAMGGFSGGDPAPTLAQFQRYVADGEVHYFIGGGGGGFGGGRNGSGSVATWVEQHYTSTTVGGTTVYDLTKPKASS
ncbi:MAG TPA: glycosyltransferase family 39 protein [Frankiaceae bacterium]|nr:glycosyltransferase family 39 protein [Frankiaceae bacterium]